MNRIEVTCENGHRLKAAAHLCGTSQKCPQCRANVNIPLQSLTTYASDEGRDTLSDTGVMRILGVQDALPPPPAAVEPEKTHCCPRCDVNISVKANVCQHCQCYVGAIPNFMKKLGLGSGSKASVA